jgi:hypothetical protein
MASKKEGAIFCRKLLSAYPNFKPRDPEIMISDLIDQFTPFPPSVLNKVYENITSTSKFFPTLFEIKENISHVLGEKNTNMRVAIRLDELKDRASIYGVFIREEWKLLLGNCHINSHPCMYETCMKAYKNYKNLATSK